MSLCQNNKAMTEDKLYSAIENAIIKWVINGTKTAGSLTREIMLIIKQQDNAWYSNVYGWTMPKEADVL